MNRSGSGSHTPILLSLTKTQDDIKYAQGRAFLKQTIMHTIIIEYENMTSKVFNLKLTMYICFVIMRIVEVTANTLL
jgi:hypothetical protein